MRNVDLSVMTRGEVAILVGYKYGERARETFQLDEIDAARTPIRVLLPIGLKTITPSFVQGFFGKSALVLGRDNFYTVYKFESWPSSLLDQISAGIELALMERPLVNKLPHAS